MKRWLTSALVLFAMLGSMPALAQLAIIKPPSRVAVPTSGAAITQPYSAVILWPTGRCGLEKHNWTRDNADAKSCNNGFCSVEYYESAATRGTHVARDASTAWVWVGMACQKISVSASRSYVVQYGPTAQIVEAPEYLEVDEGASFIGTGSVDTQFAANPTGTYRLDFGDGNHYDSSSAYYFYSSPGTYVITYTVSDGYFTATAQRTVHVGGQAPCGPGTEIICP